MANSTAGTKSAVHLLDLSEIKPVAVRWLWPQRIPRGKLTIVAGEPGVGKSTASLDLAARISTGTTWPDGMPVEQPGDVILLTAEDDQADTVVPRLLAVRADCSKIHALTGVISSRGQSGFSLCSAEHIDALDAAMAKLPNVRAIIIDPLASYLDGINTLSNTKVRAALLPIKNLAERTGASVIGIAHFRKGNGEAPIKALHAVLDSVAFTAAARAVHLVMKDAENPKRRLWLFSKSNLSAEGGGLAYTIEPAQIEGGIETSRVVWDPTPLDMSADDVMQREADARRENTREACAEAALLDLLESDGPTPREKALDKLTHEGHSKRTIIRAFARLTTKGVALSEPGPQEGAGNAKRWRLAHLP